MDFQRDQNHVTVGGGVSSSDSVTPESFRLDAATEYVLADVIDDGITATSATSDKRDQNYVPTMYGISSVDGVTLVPIRTDSNGRMLIDLLII